MIERLKIPRKFDGMVWPYRNTGVRYRRHRHHELEVNFVLQGRARYLVWGRSVRLMRGTILWLPSDSDHTLLDQSDDFRMFIAVFRSRIAAVRTYRRLAEQLKLAEGEIPCRQLLGGEGAALGALFGDVGQSSGDAECFNLGLAYLHRRAVQCFVEHAAPMTARSIHPAVVAAARLIELDLAEDSLPKLAEQVHLSASRLSALFRQQLGVSMTTFRNQRRLDRMVELCRQGQPKLLAAALRAGFGSYAQFHRVCTKLTGKGPRALLGRDR